MGKLFKLLNSYILFIWGVHKYWISYSLMELYKEVTLQHRQALEFPGKLLDMVIPVAHSDRWNPISWWAGAGGE